MPDQLEMTVHAEKIFDSIMFAYWIDHHDMENLTNSEQNEILDLYEKQKEDGSSI